jgi:hypothetical protein
MPAAINASTARRIGAGSAGQAATTWQDPALWHGLRSELHRILQRFEKGIDASCLLV